MCFVHSQGDWKLKIVCHSGVDVRALNGSDRARRQNEQALEMVEFNLFGLGVLRNQPL